MPSYCSRFRGAVFDLDGTLLDSMWLWGEIDRRFLSRRGLEVPSDYLEAVKHMDFPHAADYTVRRFLLQERPEDLIAEWMSMAETAYREEIVFKPGALDLLRRLRELGFSVGIATSASPSLFLPTLERHGARELFDAIVTTEEAGRSKADPAVYLACAAKLGVEPAHCMVFEDILTGIKSAKRAGFYTVALRDPSSESSRAILTAEAELYAEDFASLLPLFQG